MFNEILGIFGFSIDIFGIYYNEMFNEILGIFGFSIEIFGIYHYIYLDYIRYNMLLYIFIIAI